MRSVGIIDYGMGNISSVKNAFEYAGADVIVVSDPAILQTVDRIVLPGVGSFGECVTSLTKRGFVESLNEHVLRNRKPILGICLGMQVMAEKGYENGVYRGLGWFKASVIRIQTNDPNSRIPHIGWNNITVTPDQALFVGLPLEPDVYFVHSYFMKCAEPQDIAATFEYGGAFTAAVHKNNIFATQFHPEKSQDIGQIIIKNFLNWRPL